MSEFNENYIDIIDSLQSKIKNKEDLEYVINKINELSITYMKNIDNIAKEYELKIKKLEDNQKSLEKQLNIIQNDIDNITKEIYEDFLDEDYEFEVVCPYCNNNFTSDINLYEIKELKCPECNNVIELDWDEEESKGCGKCQNCNGCKVEENQIYKDFFNDKSDKEDDM